MAEIRGKRVFTSPHLTINFDMDYAGIGRYAMTSGELGHCLDDIAEAGKHYAEFISPYDPDEDGGEHYRDSWEVVPYVERNTGDPPFPRQARLLINQSPHAVFVEHGNGTAQFPGDHVLSRTVTYLEHLRP